MTTNLLKTLASFFLLFAITVCGAGTTTKSDIDYLKRNAGKGNASSQYFLALKYSIGDGVPQNNKTAFSWYEKAANQGHANAQYDLGLMYTGGDGIPQNYSQCYIWVSMAIVNESNAAAETHGYGIMRDCAKKLTPKELLLAQEKATSIYVKIAQEKADAMWSDPSLTW